jgi:hypothetical protein
VKNVENVGEYWKKEGRLLECEEFLGIWIDCCTFYMPALGMGEMIGLLGGGVVGRARGNGIGVARCEGCATLPNKGIIKGIIRGK